MKNPFGNGSEDNVKEEAIPIENIDPAVCKEKLKGDIDDYGRCVVRVKIDPDEQNKAELLKLKFAQSSRGPKNEKPSISPPE